MDAARARKLGGRIEDPRLGFVTVTEARLTNDLREATVFYTVYGSAEEHAGTAAALASAVGVIRSEVGRQTGLRHTPSLEFRLDTVPDNARNIEELVARAREADAALAAVREGAEPAGDADPYRVPAATDDDSEDDDSEGDDSEAGRSESARLAEPSAGLADASAGLGYPPAAAPRGEDDHLAESPAPGERGAGYSRS